MSEIAEERVQRSFPVPQLVAVRTPAAGEGSSSSAAEAVPLRQAGKSQLLHELLAKILKDHIISGEWPAGSRIMSEHALMERYCVSRGTVRRAIGMLVDEGLLVQRKGKGTFVTRSGVAHPGGARPLSFAHALKEQGLAFETQVLAKEVLPAPADVAQELGLETGESVLFMRRVRTVEGRAIVCQESWENLEACPGLADADFTTESLFDAVERCSGHEIALSNMRSSATCAGKEHGGYLALPAEAPVLLLEQTISLDNHVPIEWSLTWLRSDQSLMGVALQDEMKRPEAPSAASRETHPLPKEERRRLDLLACQIREDVVATAKRYPDMPFHIGGAFSAAEILSVLFGAVLHTGKDGTPWEERDRFVLSKAHAAVALYPALRAAGLISQDDVDKGLFGPDAVLFKHPRRDPARGLETSGGSLGMGLGYAAGLALALKRKKLSSRVFCLVGDGECNEGSTWEAAAFAGHNRLSALTVIVDANGMQLDGPTSEILDTAPLAQKFAAFGFETVEVDGHDVEALFQALTATHEVPRAVIAHTVKGKGLSFAAGVAAWHDHNLGEELWERAEAELASARKAAAHE
ncbi:MAG: UTRA domain-containing protein [Atopobiaceae bacterium]